MVKKIVLVGFMGAGKTSLARALASRLKYEIFEVDFEIEKISGKSISQLFAEDGEDHFRSLESQVLERALATPTSRIISPGGGCIEREKSREMLRESECDVVFLRTGWKTLCERLRSSTDRPLWQNEEEAFSRFVQRQALYEEVAELIIDTDSRSVDELSEFLSPLFEIQTLPRKRPSFPPGRQLCFVVGTPIAHSLSPLIHEHALRETGLKDRFCYAALRLEPEQAPDLVPLLKSGMVKGLSVTLPLKEVLYRHVEQLDEAARVIGAVNTVFMQDGIIRGSNTDWVGILQALKTGGDLAHRPLVAILGAGGTARAAAFVAQKLEARLEIFNRTEKRAKALAQEFGGVAYPLEAFDSARYDIVIQTTSLGMGSSMESPVSFPVARSGAIALDLVYSPRMTAFLSAAQHAGARVVYGDEVLLQQAVMQFELFFGARAPVEKMRVALQERMKVRLS